MMMMKITIRTSKLQFNCGSIPLLIDSIVFGDKLVHEQRHGLALGRQLLHFAAVRVYEVDNAQTAWTEVAHDGYEDDDKHERNCSECNEQLCRMHSPQSVEHKPLYNMNSYC